MSILTLDVSENVKEFYLNDVRRPGDAGVDLYMPEDVTIPAGACCIISLGVRSKMRSNDDERPLSYYIYPRSSISKTPLMLSNSVGLIDQSYRGVLKAALRNMDNESPFTVERGSRLVQVCGPVLEPLSVEFGTVDPNETERGEGGFGSTGK